MWTTDAGREKGGRTQLGAIKQLVGDDNVERRVILAQTADRAQRNDALDAERFERVDVRGNGEFVRLDAMTASVARQERDALVT